MPKLHTNARLAGALIAGAGALGVACGDPTVPPSANASLQTVGPQPTPVGPGASGDSGARPVGPGPSPTDAGIVLPDAAPAPVDPCPNLPIPTTLFNRSVLFREWSVSAVGDGTYFASQAPYRLGFTRVQHRVWIMKFRTDANSYIGKVSAGADSVGGLSWISHAPDDVSWALQNKLVAWSGHGDALLSFMVIKDDADAQKLATDPSLAQWRGMPTLRGDHCYYFGFENATTVPSSVDASFWNSSDECGATGNGTCWYLGIDFGHLLRDPMSGATYAGNVIAGLSSP